VGRLGNGRPARGGAGRMAWAGKAACAETEKRKENQLKIDFQILKRNRN
jgi:hypothetical protein